MSTYAFDQGWEKERDRLGGLEAVYDSYSTQRLAALGVTVGWRCLEVGFGAGGIALWLADKVGSTGRVVATDLDPRFLDGHGRANLDVRKHDILTDPLEEAAFDVVHARLVLMWLPEWQRALERMISALRPGGWLVLEDGDFGGVMAPAIAHYTDPPEYAALYERIVRAFDAFSLVTHADANFGARMVRGLTDAGLVNIGGEAHTALVAGGTEKWLPGMVEFAAGHRRRHPVVSCAACGSIVPLRGFPACHSLGPAPSMTTADAFDAE